MQAMVKVREARGGGSAPPAVGLPIPC